MSGGIETSDQRAPESVSDDPKPRPISFGVALGVIVLVGLAWRIAYVVWTRDHPIFEDSLGYHFRALELADGNGFVLPIRQILGADLAAQNPPDAFVPPLWTTVLSLPTMLGLRSILSQQLAVCAIGASTIAMAGLAARQAFGRRPGLIAAALVAVYPNIWLYERELLSEPLTMLLISTLLWLVYRFFANPTTHLVVALGAIVGALILTRAEQVLLVPLLLPPVVLTARSVPFGRRAAWLTVAGVVCLLMLVPWTAYNWNRFEKPVLLSTGAGLALRSGNCERVYSGDLLGYSDPSFFDSGRIDGCDVTDPERETDPTLLNEQLQRAALDFMRANSGRVPVVAAARIGRTFNFYRPFQQVYLEAGRETPIPVLRAGLFSYWLLVPFAVLGAIAARRRRIPIYPLLVPFAIVVLSVAMTIGAVRYRASAEIPFLILVSIGIDRALSRLRRGAGADVGGSVEPADPVVVVP